MKAPQRSVKIKLNLIFSLRLGLGREGLNLKGYNDTAIFVKAITTLYCCINVKSKDAWFKLNDEYRKPFESADDQRLKSILQLPEKFKDTDNSKIP